MAAGDSFRSTMNRNTSINYKCGLVLGFARKLRLVARPVEAITARTTTYICRTGIETDIGRQTVARRWENIQSNLRPMLYFLVKEKNALLLSARKSTDKKDSPGVRPHEPRKSLRSVSFFRADLCRPALLTSIPRTFASPPRDAAFRTPGDSSCHPTSEVFTSGEGAGGRHERRPFSLQQQQTGLPPLGVGTDLLASYSAQLAPEYDE